MRVLAISAALLVFVLLLSLFVGGGDEQEQKKVRNTATTEEVQQLPEQEGSVLPADQQAYEDYVSGNGDRGDYDFESPTQRKEAIEYISRQSALYELPYRGKSIRASFVRTLENSQYLIEVVYSGSISSANKEWKAFLRKHKDSGRTYFVVYKKA